MENASSKDYTKEETEFAIFCIENVALHLKVDASVVYHIFAQKSDILDSYIIHNIFFSLCMKHIITRNDIAV